MLQTLELASPRNLPCVSENTRPADSLDWEGTDNERDIFIAAILLNSYDKLMANILTYLPTDIHYLFIIKISLGHAACHYLVALGEKRLQLNKWGIVALAPMACCYSKIILSLNYSNIKSIENKKECRESMDVGGGGNIPILQHTNDSFIVFFSGRNTFIICPSKQRNRKYPSAWKWQCHLPSGSCFSLAGGRKHYVIVLHLISGRFRPTAKKKNGHIFHIWFFLFPLVQILHPSARPHVWMRLDMEMSNVADQ